MQAKIIYNKKVKEKYFYLLITAPLLAKNAEAGQFVNIRLNSACDEPLLRRPLGIHRVDKKNIGLLYEVVGKGTGILSKKKPGEDLDIIGPLGRGFDYAQNKGRAIIVSGGMGVAPLVFLAEKLAKFRNTVLIGVKTKNQILCEDEFKRLGCEVQIATDDGSKGFKGKVTGLLKKNLRTMHNVQYKTIYACGPKPMLKEVAAISRRYNIPAQLSLEEHLACGIGACLGCVIDTKTGYQRVCKEGPVFSADQIIWKKEKEDL